MPEFRKWFDRERKNEASTVFKPSDAHALSLLDEPNWFTRPEVVNEVKPLLCSAAAHYFLIARTRKGRPVDPVARFHLGNGARLERINPMADLSEKGTAQSYGVMVNYRYILDDIEKNHEAYAGAGEIVASSAVKKLLRADAKQTALCRQHEQPSLRRDRAGHSRSQQNPDRTSRREENFLRRDVLAGGEALRPSDPQRRLRGDRVAAQVEKSWQNSRAVSRRHPRRRGVICRSTPPIRWPSSKYFLGDAKPSFVVVRPETENDIRTLCRRIGKITVQSLGPNGEGSLLPAAADAPDTDPRSRAPDELAAILYTSGTTAARRARCSPTTTCSPTRGVLVDTWRFTGNDVLLHALPIFHTHGLFVASNTSLLSGGSMIFLSKFDNDTVIRLLPKATAMMAVPTFYVRLLEDPRFNRELTKHMRLFTSGSAPLLAETHRHVFGTHRPRDSRALRHDRNQHEHLDPL